MTAELKKKKKYRASWVYLRGVSAKTGESIENEKPRITIDNSPTD